MGVMYLCRYTLFFRIALGVGVKTMSFYIMQTCLALRTIFNGIKVVPLTTLAAFRTCLRDERPYNLSNTLQWIYFPLVFPQFLAISLIFMNMQMR